MKKTRIIASVDLHADTFQPRNGTQTSVLVVQKKTTEEIQKELIADTIRPYEIFMAMVQKIGHDKRGNTLFKRDEEGNELWEPEESNVLEVDRTAEGGVAYRTESKTRIKDDQSVEVPIVFDQWKLGEGIGW